MNNFNNITDNIYVTSKKNLDFIYLKELQIYNIKYIININNYSNIFENNQIQIFNVNIDKINIYISSANFASKIDFEYIDNIILDAIKNNSAVLICDENYIVPFLIIGRFLCKYYKLTFTESITWLSHKLNLNIDSKIYKNIIYQLFLQFSSLN